VLLESVALAAREVAMQVIVNQLVLGDQQLLKQRIVRQ
jgi:hypothetical protein